MSDKDWRDRYEITSVKGRIWSRAELRNRTVKNVVLLVGDQSREAIRAMVQAVLDDAEFMRGRRGMVPARVIEDAAIEAFLRFARQGKKS